MLKAVKFGLPMRSAQKPDSVAAPPQGGGSAADRAPCDDRDRTPVLRVALLGIAQRHRALLAIGDRGYPFAGNTLRNQEFTRCGRPARRQSNIIFAGAAL